MDSAWDGSSRHQKSFLYKYEADTKNNCRVLWLIKLWCSIQYNQEPTWWRDDKGQEGEMMSSFII
jgi:hypothetical protein